LSSSVDLTQVAGELPENVTGADIGSVTSKAFLIALTKKLNKLREQFLNEEAPIPALPEQHESIRLQSYINKLPRTQLEVTVSQEDLFLSCQSLKPSVINVSHYDQLQEKFDNIS
jgi:SpoVK/Ycf46/Vps4 family AAA+-type ATPase